MCFVATKSIFILVCGIFILPTKSIFWLVSTQVFNKVNFYPHSREPIIWWVFGQPITEFNNFPYGCAQPQCFPHTPLTISETTAHQTSVYLTITSEKHAHQSIRLVTTHISQHCQNVKNLVFCGRGDVFSWNRASFNPFVPVSGAFLVGFRTSAIIF